MGLMIATRPGWGSESVCTFRFFFVVAILLAMFAYAFEYRDRRLSEHWRISLFPPVLCLADILLGGSWSFFILPDLLWRRHYILGLDEAMISILCVPFGLFFALEARRGPRRWQRILGSVFAVHSVIVIVCVLLIYARARIVYGL